MKKLLIIAFFVMVLGSALSWADGESNTIIIKYAGVPSGACSFIMLGMNGSNGNLYTCPSGTWVLLGGGGGSGTVTSCGPGLGVYTANGTTITCDPLLTDTSLNGSINSAQGSLSASAPWLNHTGTWNNGAVTFTDIFSNITSCLAAAGSKPIDLQAASVSVFQIRYAAANCGTPQMQVPEGVNATPGLFFPTDGTGTGLYRNGANDWAWTNGTNPFFRAKINSGTEISNNGCYGISSTTSAVGTLDAGWDRQAAGVLRADANSACNDGLGKVQSQLYTTTANCAGVGTAANPSVASCAGASAGSFSCSVSASTGTCVVNTTAVTANSEIFIHQRSDTVTGTRLGVTCNTGLSTTVEDITAVTAGTSFTINLGTITTNPECFSYLIIN